MCIFPDFFKQLQRQWKSLRLPLTTPLALRTNFVWTLVGNIVYFGAQWGMITVMAKLGSPEMVGRFSYAVAICTPIIMFTNLQLRIVLATDAKGEFHFQHYLGLRIFSSFLAFLAICGVALVSGFRQETFLVVLVVGLAKAFEAVSDVIFGLLQKHERMDRIAISKSVKGVLSLLALGSLILTTKSLIYGVLGLVATWLLMLLIYDIHNAKKLSSLAISINTTEWSRLIKLALPLGIVMMLLSLIANVPRYFVEHYQGESGLGFYSALAYLVVAGNLIVSALGQSATPRLSRFYAESNKRAFVLLLSKLMAIGFVFGIAGVAGALLLGRAFLTFFYRPEYAEYNHILVWLMLAGGVGFVASVLGYGMSAARFFRIQLPLFTAVTVCILIACAVLVPKLGLVGAALATLIASFAKLVGSGAIIYFALNRLQPESMQKAEAG